MIVEEISSGAKEMPESNEVTDLIGRTFANNKFTIIELIGSGSFSSIFKVKEITGTRELAVKLEPIESKNPQLSHEFAIYQILRHECNHSSIPKTYFFGEFGLYVALVMQLFGPSLALKFDECGKIFSVKTVILLAVQIIDIFQYLHSRRIIYRDVKPENLLLGLSQTKVENKLHLIDFGLAKEYKSVNGVHITYSENQKLIGTVRYMSINSNLKREQSRRDDMEAIGHMLIYFLKGSLPWSGLKIDDTEKLFVKIGKIKQNTKLEDFCSDLPNEFCNYMKTVRSLEFTEEPNYKQLSELFETLLKNNNQIIDEVFDWNDRKNIEELPKKTDSKTVSNTTINATKND